MRLFHPESPLMKAFAFVGDLFLLNLCFLLCALPVVTLGASAAALYSVTLKLVRGEEGPLARSFFAAFRQNFRKSTGAWLLLLLAGYLLWYGTEIIAAHPQDFPFVVSLAYGVIAVLLLFAGAWVFPLQASFENTVLGSFKNALILVFTHPLRAISVTALSWAPLALLLFAPYFAILASFFFFLFGFSGIALINSHIIRRILDGVTNKEGVSK